MVNCSIISLKAICSKRMNERIFAKHSFHLGFFSQRKKSNKLVFAYLPFITNALSTLLRREAVAGARSVKIHGIAGILAHVSKDYSNSKDDWQMQHFNMYSYTSCIFTLKYIHIVTQDFRNLS